MTHFFQPLSAQRTQFAHKASGETMKSQDESSNKLQRKWPPQNQRGKTFFFMSKPCLKE